MSRYCVTQQVMPAYDATAYFLTDAERSAEAILYPELGNNCVEFRTTPDPDRSEDRGPNNEAVNLFVPPSNIADLRRWPVRGGQPILFPFPNRVKDGAYTYEGQTYHLARLMASGGDDGAGNAIHGLACGKPWMVEEAQADDSGATVRCSLQLDAYSDIYAQYPFPCRILVTYRLCEGRLEMRTEVRNTGEKALPMGFGIHPWFPTVLRPGASLQELSMISAEERRAAEVKVPASALWDLDECLPTGTVRPAASMGAEFDLRRFVPLNGHYFDHVFTQMTPDADGWCRGGLRDPASGLELVVAADLSFREWVLYAPEHSPIVCHEPYTCTTNAVNLELQGIDAGLIALPAGETWSGEIHFGLCRFTD